MTDIVTPAKRSKMMSGIQGKNTKPELIIRKGLHALGFRYRLHDRKLPGTPDLVFARYKAVIFIHGCFWHHHSCHLFKWPSSRKEFWETKIIGNVERDVRNLYSLKQAGWRVLIVWECAIKGRTKLPIDKVFEQVSNWLKTGTNDAEIQGTN